MIEIEGTISMIYVCEFDGSISSDLLLRSAKELPLDLPENINAEERDKKWQSARQRILAWLMLKKAWEKESGTSFEKEKIKRGAKGKPYMDTSQNLYFNLSHCETACACIISDTECGIDVERKFSYRNPLAKRICHVNEWENMVELDEEKRESYLQRLWSMKESYVKYTGSGITIDLKTLDFSGQIPFAGQEERSELQGICIQEKTYTLACCAQRLNLEMIRYRENELI